ncbi:MAG: glycoside hydrolase family 16 protein [Bacillota bacterium]
MKRYIQSIVMIFFLVFLVACTETNNNNNDDNRSDDNDIIDDNDSSDDKDIVGEVPGFNGVTDISYYVGDTYHPLEGITAIDEEDGNITDLIEILGEDELPLDENVFTSPGEFSITYLVMDEDANTARETITITVIDNDDTGNCDYQYEGYELTWCDDFTGTGSNLNERGVNLDHWDFQLGTGSQYGLNGWGNNEEQYYRSENARVEDGKLIIEAKNEVHDGKPYTSSRLYTKHLFAQTYGRFEAMIKLPEGEGLWPAFWLMPQDDAYGGWANSGEIDIMEARGRLPHEVSSALHYGGSWPDNVYTHETYSFPNGQSITDENLYAVEWDEQEMRFYVNNTLYHTVTDWYNTGHDYPAPFDQSFYIILNLAVGGTFDGGRTPSADVFNDPVEMIVSYVRVYQREAN